MVSRNAVRAVLPLPVCTFFILPPSLKPLSDGELKDVVGSLLGSFKALAFYPDCTQALILAARLRPFAMGPAENALIAEVETEVRGVLGFSWGVCVVVVVVVRWGT